MPLGTMMQMIWCLVSMIKYTRKLKEARVDEITMMLTVSGGMFPRQAMLSVRPNVTPILLVLLMKFCLTMLATVIILKMVYMLPLVITLY